MTALQFQLFPALSEDEYTALKEDIARRGVMVPVELDDEGNILDGHHRVQICDELGLKEYPRFVRTGMTEDEKIEHVLTLNLARRHLNDEQRAELGATLHDKGYSYRRIGKLLGVDEKTIRNDLAGAEFSAPDYVVGADGKSYPARAPLARTAQQLESVLALPEDLREQVALGERTIRTAIQDFNRSQRVIQAVVREKDGRRVPPAPGKTYQTIVIDPPWAYERDDIRGSAEQHYDTMSFDEIIAYPVAPLAAKDCYLFLWVTNPHIPDVFRREIVEAWGFDYKTLLTWVKPQIGNGHYFRGATEHVIFAVRGSLPIRDQGLINWFQADRTEHSAKPEAFYELVERASYGPIVELFARRARDGWDVYGDEAPQ